jgi:hypothetical protein
MAVIEIARIQVRRGQENQTGIPQLAGGEFAWAADTERLLIGLTREDGGSRDDNVEILTENHLRNFFTTLTTTATYTYRVGSYITAEDGTNEFDRTVQQRLDDNDVSVLNFGAVGDYINDDTATLQVAIDNLFLNALELSDNPARTLRFPPGTFRITETLYIPKGTVIVGEGIDKTIIKIASTGSHIFQTVDSRSEGGLAGYVTFDNTTTMISNQLPEGIKIQGLTLEYDSVLTTVTNVLSMMSLDCATNALIKDVKFKGNYGIGVNTSTNHVGIDIRGYQSVTADNIIIDNCYFENLYYGVKSNYDITNPVVQYSKFKNLHKGITFNDPKDSLAGVGPRFGRFVNNKFYDIENEAIYFGTNGTTTGTHHVLLNNQYFNVGNRNSLAGEDNPLSGPVVSFLSAENVSQNDYHDRYEYQLKTLSTNTPYFELIAGKNAIYKTEVKSVVVNQSANAEVLRLPLTDDHQRIEVKYQVYVESSTSTTRMGVLNIYVKNGTPTPYVSYDDAYHFVDPADSLNWSTSYDMGLNSVRLFAQNNSGSENYTIDYQFNIMYS